MTTHYVDPAAGGANNGTSWADAWTSFQSALDTAVAGDIVYMRGTARLKTNRFPIAFIEAIKGLKKKGLKK